MNGTIEQILTIDNPKNWYKFVPRLQRAINDAVARSTGYTPFRLMFGIEMKNPETLELKKVLEEELTKLFARNSVGRKSVFKVKLKNSLKKPVVTIEHRSGAD